MEEHTKTRQCADFTIPDTCSSELAEGGAGDQTIMDIAGHVSRQMLKHYSHIRMEAKRKALQAVWENHEESQSARDQIENAGVKDCDSEPRNASEVGLYAVNGGKPSLRLIKRTCRGNVLISTESIIGLPEYELTSIEEVAGQIRIRARYIGPVKCPHCQGDQLRRKDKRLRRPRHESWGQRHTVVELESRKWLCQSCRRSFWQRFPGIQPRLRASEPFRRSICQKHFDGISRSRLSQRELIASSTIERWFASWLRQKAGERISRQCPQLLGIDEHFFSRRHGYATTFCDLKNRKVQDVVLGRSEASLESYIQRLEGKALVKVVCMDLSATYRALVRKYFPQARIVADRFHVIRLVNHHFVACWKEIDPVGSKHRGLVKLMRRHRHTLTVEQQQRLWQYLAQHPLLELVYRFKQKLCYLLLKKNRNQHHCRKLAPRLLRMITQLRQSPLRQLEQLGHTLHSWREEITTMWRFSRNNGITEGFHTKNGGLTAPSLRLPQL